MREACIVVAFTAFSACHTSSPPGAAEAVAVRSAPAPNRAALKLTMRAHDAEGASLRDAIVRGDLEGARSEARFLADLRSASGGGPSWDKDLEAMNLAAARVARAASVVEAANELPALTRACGNCHAALGGPPATIPEAPEPTSEVVPRMKRHAWAAARLWDGLVIPSDKAWRSGARVLADAPLAPELLTPGRTPVARIDALARSVHELASKAAAVESPVDRSAVYGELLSACATCHGGLDGGSSP